MTRPAVYIADFGIVTALGKGADRTLSALKSDRSALFPVNRFHPPAGDPLPVGQVEGLAAEETVPHTHRLAQAAGDRLLSAGKAPPEAIVIGTTTGGMDLTERLLLAGEKNPASYRLHGAGTVAATLARRFGCTGPALTVSTACSSGAAAVALAAALIRTGRATRVLAGGVDALCRLTYYGFFSLQLIDPSGARPLDRDRKGMSVAEGAALVMLTADGSRRPLAEIAGAGLSCDAWHPTAPHPDGVGAFAAMENALKDADLAPDAIDYINLHGTGTIDNDLSEARAVRSLFRRRMPPLSSIKGATGHSLAASGAVETAVAALAVRHGLMPANTGCRRPDPALKLSPLLSPKTGTVRAVMSNAFGFGGSNVAIVVTEPDRFPAPAAAPQDLLRIETCCCLTGGGKTGATLARISEGIRCAGVADDETVCNDLNPRQIRRLRRLPRLALSLAAAACDGQAVESVYFGTGWGALSETDRFLTRLFESGERYPSPTDFVGSVHNAPAGQIAQAVGAKGANLTLTGSTDAFEQAVLAADISGAGKDGPVLVVGADEAHGRLSPLLAPAAAGHPADGGGAMLLKRGGTGPAVSVLFCAGDGRRSGAVEDLLRALKDRDAGARYGAVLAAIPADTAQAAKAQLEQVGSGCRFSGPVIDYLPWVGQFATASAAAAVLAARWVTDGQIPAALSSSGTATLDGRGILLIGLGDSITAMEVVPE
jgi:3-oxoacyl-[acyl-carrier-protein] synthase-1/3-oxoacyl-[acyl-carrier-protein] synthase II